MERGKLSDSGAGRPRQDATASAKEAQARVSSSSAITIEGIARANAAELERLLDQHVEELTPALARQVLRNPHLEPSGIAALLSRRSLLASYELKVALARHRSTPVAVAMGLVPGLYWRDLAWLARDQAVPPRIRRQAEQNLRQRLPGLTLGERISLARLATGGVLGDLATDDRPRVIAALLSNPKTTESLVVRLAATGRSGAVLELVAGTVRWGRRRAVAAALSTNPATPFRVVLGLLPRLDKRQLRAITGNQALAAPIRRRARLLSGW